MRTRAFCENRPLLILLASLVTLGPGCGATAEADAPFALAGVSEGIGMASDGVCTFDWEPHYEPLVRLTDRFDPATGRSETVPFTQDELGLIADASAAAEGLRETWYVPRFADARNGRAPPPPRRGRPVLRPP